jgi:hypothetical protein
MGVECLEFGPGNGFEGIERGERGFDFLAASGALFDEKGAGERRLGGRFFLEQVRATLPDSGELAEHFRQGSGDRCSGRRGVGPFEFEEMFQTQSGFAQGAVCGIQCCGFFAAVTGNVRMMLGGGAMKSFLERGVIQPRPAGLMEGGKMIGHEERLARRTVFLK